MSAQTAEALLETADGYVRKGRLREAVSAINAAADAYTAIGDEEAAARCLTLASTAARLSGATAQAVSAATRASELAAGRPRERQSQVGALAELGEGLLAAGKPADAVEQYSAALEALVSSNAEPQPAARAGLLRKRGLACALADQGDAAVADLEAAAEAFRDAAMSAAFRTALVEAATLAAERSTATRADHLRARAGDEALAAGDHAALVDLDLLDASVAVRAQDLDTALACTERARQRALDGVVPIKYLSAAVAMSALRDLRDEREDAYETLSTAWATLADLMGRDVAKAVIQPRLQLLNDRWGVAEFAAVKTAYESRRRAELGLR